MFDMTSLTTPTFEMESREDDTNKHLVACAKVRVFRNLCSCIRFDFHMLFCTPC